MLEELKYNKYFNRACREVTGFTEPLQRFERNISILGRSPRTFDNYSRHVASMALHFDCLPTGLDPEQVKDYLYELQRRSQTPSQTYFKHTDYGLRFLLKSEGLYSAIPIFRNFTCLHSSKKRFDYCSNAARLRSGVM